MKSVPETTAEKRLLPDGTLDRASVPVIINPWDEYAIEEALRIREGGDGSGEIILLCMGPENSTETIRKGLARGADRAVRVTDPALQDSGTGAAWRGSEGRRGRRGGGGRVWRVVRTAVVMRGK